MPVPARRLLVARVRRTLALVVLALAAVPAGGVAHVRQVDGRFYAGW